MAVLDEQGNGWPYRIRSLEKWREHIESLKPEVQADVLQRVEKKVDTLTRIMVTTLLTLLSSMGGLIVYLLTGGHA